MKNLKSIQLFWLFFDKELNESKSLHDTQYNKFFLNENKSKTFITSKYYTNKNIVKYDIIFPYYFLY